MDGAADVIYIPYPVSRRGRRGEGGGKGGGDGPSLVGVASTLAACWLLPPACGPFLQFFVT